jgi:cyclopropane fatty-acyl-phospholipid synthase-like methyltransferase
MSLPHAPACDRNSAPILAELRELLVDSQNVLEIGSGTGQHAIYFARALSHLTWHTSDLPNSHAGIKAWLQQACLRNVSPPLHLDVSTDEWPEVQADAVFTANSLHIMSWSAVQQLIRLCGENLPTRGRLIVYGPFNYQGSYSSDSNAQFDLWLKERNPVSAIRHFEEVNSLAEEVGLQLHADTAMPANNRLICWQKV